MPPAEDDLHALVMSNDNYTRNRQGPGSLGVQPVVLRCKDLTCKFRCSVASRLEQ